MRKSLRVLVVERDELSREALLRAIRSKGHKTDGLGTAVEVGKKVRSGVR